MKKSVCVGTGLVALDVILNGNPSDPPKFFAGGSCGNVLIILSYLNWQVHPIARLGKNRATTELVKDFKHWNVNTDLISISPDGSTSIIIHRIFKNKQGQPIHKFEFKDPDTGSWLPSYKPVLQKDVNKITTKQPKSEVFYFDRVTRGSIELAKFNKTQGALIFFEPTSIRDNKLFKECLEVSDILKFSRERIRNYEILFPKQQAFLEIETLAKSGLRFRYSKNKTAIKWNKLEAFKISPLIDSAGAGDWCSAGIIVKLGRGGIRALKKTNKNNVISALKYGQALGAINCCFDGARGAMYNLNKEQLNKTTFSLLKDKKKIIDFNTSSINNVNFDKKKISIATLFK